MSSEFEGGVVPLAENSWTGLLALFLTQVNHKDGFCGCLDSLVKVIDSQDWVLY